MHAQKVILLKSKINSINIKELYDDALKNVEITQVCTNTCFFKIVLINLCLKNIIIYFIGI